MSDWGNEYPALVQAIADHLGGVLTPLQVAVVFGSVKDGEAAPRTAGGQLRPFVVLDFASPQDTAGDWGITGVADQMGMFAGAALCISESYMNTIKLVGLVANTLRGYRPTPDCSEIEIYASVARLPVDALMHPSRFSQTVGFGMSIGATVVP